MRECDNVGSHSKIKEPLRILCIICCLITSLLSAQVWTEVPFDDHVRFKFPENFTKVDSADFIVYSRKTPVGLFRALKTKEQIDVESENALVELYHNYKEKKLIFDAELVDDELVMFKKTKAAKYVTTRIKNERVVLDYYITFFTAGHFYVFQYTYTSNAPCSVIWSNDLHNSITIFPPVIPDIVEPKHIFSIIQILPIFVICGTVLLTVAILMRKKRHLF